MKQFIKILIIGWIGLSMMGCQGCKEPVMVDPCEGVTEVTADFKMEYSMGIDDYIQWYEVDTICEVDMVRFSAVGKYDSIKWKVGLDPREFTEKEFSLRFMEKGSVQIRMIGFRAPNLECFPTDDGIDTIFKQLTIVPREESLILGEFDGYFQSEPDTPFTMKIVRLYNSIWTPEFPKGCIKNPYFEGAFKWCTYRRFFNNDGNGHCQGSLPFVWGQYFNDTLRVDYEYPSGEKGTFIGIKK